MQPGHFEIEWKGTVWRGVVVGGLGVLTNDFGSTYAGGVTGRVPNGRGVIKWSDGGSEYCELAAGERHGYSEYLCANGTVVYFLHERGKPVHRAHVCADGGCAYDGPSCGADHAGHAALKDAAQQAAVRPPPRPRRPLSYPPWGLVRGVRVPRSAAAAHP